jgi:hypothetical protein
MKTLCVGMFRTKKLSPFQLDLHHFNPPPKAISYKRDNEALHQIGKILGMNNVFKLKGTKGCRLNMK